MLIMIVENNVVPYLGGMLVVENIVHTANTIFLEDQAQMRSENQMCCVQEVDLFSDFLGGGGGCNSERQFCMIMNNNVILDG